MEYDGGTCPTNGELADFEDGRNAPTAAGCMNLVLEVC